jgi:predicted ATPase/DNA-binding CsgD family transcriptional regulator
MANGQQVTAREAAVLGAIGRRLTNPEIAAEFHLSVRTIESHIASLRRKLGVDSRAALVEQAAIRTGTVPARPGNSFVGRGADLAAVGSLLRGSAVVTLTGPGGTGKTRLALEVAARAERPTVLVGLQDIAPAEVVAEVARRVGVGPAAGDLAAACALALARRPHLLLLDNCDRVTDMVASLIGDLLAGAAGLCVLATSRCPLGRADETVYRVAPLSTQDAVVLLADRARAAATTTDLDDVVFARLGSRLDGLPLAIELAAARLNQLPPSDLERELDRGLSTLDRGGIDEEHTLTSIFAWSFDQLTDAERVVAVRLAALPGPINLDLAEAVGGPGAAAVTLRLLDRSFVVPAASPTAVASFRVLEVMRELVLARAPDEVVTDARRRHAHHVAGLMSMVAATARTDDSPAAVARFAELVPAAIAALHWARDNEDPIALRFARDLAVGAEQYGPSAGLVAALGELAADDRVLAGADAETLLDVGVVLSYGDLDLVDRVTRCALEIESVEDRSVATTHVLAGMTAAYRDRTESALRHLAIAEAAAERLEDAWLRAAARQYRGLAMARTDPAAAIDEFRAAAGLYASAGDAMHVNNARFMMAHNAADAGVDPTRAIGWADQCVAYADSVGNRHELAHALLTRARLTDLADELPRAVEIFEAVGDLRCLARCHLHLAQLGHDLLGNLERAYDVATAARDAPRRAHVLERLVQVHVDAGRHREAALALGTLTIIGEERALAAIPAGFLVDDWTLVLAEGRARAR